MKSGQPMDKRILEIRNTRRALEDEMQEASAVYRNHVEMVGKVYGEKQAKDGLSQTMRMLIALGVAINSGAESAVDWTLSRARNHGASEQMIRDAIDVSLLTGGGLAVSNARFAYAGLKGRPQKS